jgi:protoheme ferro-lyase
MQPTPSRKPESKPWISNLLSEKWLFPLTEGNLNHPKKQKQMDIVPVLLSFSKFCLESPLAFFF